MTKRTAQEWADFTGEEIQRNTKTFDTSDYSVVIDEKFVSDFMNYNFLQIIKPSEQHVLIPTRLIEEASEIIERMNTALDGKIKEVDGQ